MDSDESVLRTALPPATDYLTYLTILEYNLDKDDLPLLHELLKDEKLVTNIGWDLVHILLPLLPESRHCLEEVASLGNPREVILKVTEELETLGTFSNDSNSSEGDGPMESDYDARDVHKHVEMEQLVMVFETLVQMLCVLHPRVKTKRPSRFLETSIPSMIFAYEKVASSEDATRAALMFIHSLSGSARPSLPPRNGETPIPTVPLHHLARDPEANQDGLAEGEDAIRMRLLQAMLSHITQMYLEQLEGQASPPLNWTARFVESQQPDRFLSVRRLANESLTQNEELRRRELLLNQMLNLATMELGMNWEFLKDALLEYKDSVASEDLPQLRFSKAGLLYLICAWLARQRGPNGPRANGSLSYEDHDDITTSILGDPQVSLHTDVPAAAVDALLRTGWAAALHLDFGSSATSERDESFNKHLQKISALAATQHSPGLRHHAYLLATHFLQSHPSSNARLAFIRDTLRFCPYSNLKEVAVSWAKAEYVAVVKEHESLKDSPSQCTTMEPLKGNVFTHELTLRDLVADMFLPDPPVISLETLQTDELLFQALLNFLYFLCSSRALRALLNVAATIQEVGVEANFIMPLEAAILHGREASGTHDQSIEAPTESLQVLQLSLDLAQNALKGLGS